MRFIKMQGAGNDYVYVDGFTEQVENPADVARKISNRRFGVGSDGLILIRPPSSPGADCRMEMYNADGSRGQMCGNGIRCVAKYVYEQSIAPGEEIRIETDAGLKTLHVRTHFRTSENGTSPNGKRGKVHRVEVNMGPPLLARSAIPFEDGGDPHAPAIDVKMSAAGRSFRVTALSMGNPHVVTRWEGGASGSAASLSEDASLSEEEAPRLDDLPLSEWGPHFENHPWLPKRTNTEFITFSSRREMNLRVWERGSGETLACGTGACAAVVAGVLNGWCEREVTVHLRGGDLEIRWAEGDDGDVFLTGPAVEVFRGDW